MSKQLFEKKVNKRIIGAILGSAILGVGGFGMSNKGKNFFKKLKEKAKGLFGFMKSGYHEMRKNMKKPK